MKLTVEDRAICRKCKLQEGTILIQKNRNNKYYWCRPCNAEKAKAYRRTERGKDVYRAMMRKQYLVNRDKIRARHKLGRSVECGDILKPEECSLCKKKVNKVNLDGHHTDYSKPLEVQWLCRQCHVVV